APLGLVLCNPFGYEAICAHRTLRHFAEAAADAGIPALRFDYDGTGDSVGEDLEPDRLSAWIASVHRAAETLRREAGCEYLRSPPWTSPSSNARPPPRFSFSTATTSRGTSAGLRICRRPGPPWSGAPCPAMGK